MKFQVTSNTLDFGFYEAADQQAARNLAAIDAGFKSEADMVRQLDQFPHSRDLFAKEVEEA